MEKRSVVGTGSVPLWFKGFTCRYQSSVSLVFWFHLESPMGNQVVDNKFSWVIKNFASMQSKKIYSPEFVIGDCKWRLRVYPKGYSRTDDYLSLYLQVANSKFLPSGWRRLVNFNLTVVNQLPEKLSLSKGAQLRWFDEKAATLGIGAMLPLTELHAKDGGFLVNDEVKIVAEVEVLEVIGELDVLEEYEEEAKPLKKVKREDGVECQDLHRETSPLKETMDVNGFQVLPSQVGSVRHLFDKHPDFALNFRPKNQPLRTACINVVLSVIETLRKSLQELSNDDLVEADNALTYLTYVGFKVDWLENKLEEVKTKKKEEQSYETRVKELEKELKEFKQKWLDIEAQLEKEKAKVLAARAHVMLDDFF